MASKASGDEKAERVCISASETKKAHYDSEFSWLLAEKLRFYGREESAHFA
jgi:hypothetical protein